MGDSVEPTQCIQAITGGTPSRNDSLASWCEAVAGTPQGAPNWLLSIWASVALRKSGCTQEKLTGPGRFALSPWRYRQEKQPLGYGSEGYASPAKKEESGPVGLFTQTLFLPLPLWKSSRPHGWWSGTSPGWAMRIQAIHSILGIPFFSFI